MSETANASASKLSRTLVFPQKMSRTADIFAKIEKVTNQTNWGAVIVMPLMFLLVTFEVIMRYVFHKPILGANEIETYMFVLITFSGFAYCWNKNGHVALDLFTEKMSPRWASIAKAFAALIGLAFYTILIIGTFTQTGISLKSGAHTWDLKIPEWPFLGLVFILSVIFAFQLFATMIQSILLAAKGEIHGT
jgi:TRAP-type C4-dicarboxylate transport system permease small subunit